MIVTFYSFKGGVGRSMALVNVGEILADRGYDVVLCDWDLEAPGLERYLLQTEDETADGTGEYERLISSPGLTDLLADYKQRLAMAAPDNPIVDHDHALLGNIPIRRPSSYAQPVSTRRPRSGSLRLLTAGRRDGENERKYAEFVTRFDWEDFYNRWAGGSYIEFLRQDLVGVREQRGSGDILLVDSRTGVTEQSGICTHHLADLVVLMSAANQANLSGIEWMASSLETDQLKALRGDRPVDVLPVRARIDDGSQIYELTEFRSDFMAAMREHFPASIPHVEALALKLEIPYRALYSFKERAVAREPIQKREQKLYDAYSALADAIVTIGLARELLPMKNDQQSLLTAIAPRTIPPDERPRLVLLSASPSEEPAARRIMTEMRHLGLNITATFDRPASAWLRDVPAADRFIAVLDPHEPPEEQFRLAPMLRQQALEPERRVIPVMPRNSSGSPFRGQNVALPASFEENDSFFSALAEELVAISGARLYSFGNVFRPYPGRNAYAAADALYFFGRDTELQELISSIDGHHRWICLGGSSGIGKTSFIHAALIPAIRAGMVAAVPANSTIVTWNIARGVSSIEDLAGGDVQGAMIVVAEDFERILLENGKATVDSVLSTVRQILESPRQLVLISSLSRTLRPRFDELPIVNEFRSNLLRYDIDALSVAGVQSVIKGPAHLARRQFERGLVNRLLEQLAAWRHAPMFINEVMKRLWDSAHGTVITHKALDDLGGVNALIGASAEEAAASLTSSGIS